MPRRREWMSRVASLLPDFRGGGMGSQLARGISGSFVIQAIGLALSLGSGVLLARSLGATSYGYYAYALAWLEFLKVPIAYGHPLLVQREVAINVPVGRWGEIRGLLRRTSQGIFLLSVVLIVAFHFLAGSGWTRAFGSPAQVRIFQLSLLMLPMLGLSAIRMAALNGLHRVTQSLLAEQIVRPLVASATIAVIWIGLGWPMDATIAMIVQIGSVTLAFLLGLVLLYRALPGEVRRARPLYRTRDWLSEVWPFMLTGGAYAFWGTLGVIMLGWYRTPAEVGIYRVAAALATLTLMPITACNMAIGPMIARLHAAGNRSQLQRMVSLSTLGLTATSSLALLGFALLGRPLLHFVFGAEYESGYSALIVLVIGHLCYSTIWTVMIALDMTGHQRFSLYALLTSALLNFLLAPLLIAPFGMAGAAAATAASWFIGHLWLVRVVRRRLDVRPTLVFAIAKAGTALRGGDRPRSGVAQP